MICVVLAISKGFVELQRCDISTIATAIVTFPVNNTVYLIGRCRVIFIFFHPKLSLFLCWYIWGIELFNTCNHLGIITLIMFIQKDIFLTIFLTNIALAYHILLRIHDILRWEAIAKFLLVDICRFHISQPMHIFCHDLFKGFDLVCSLNLFRICLCRTSEGLECWRWFIIFVGLRKYFHIIVAIWIY